MLGRAGFAFPDRGGSLFKSLSFFQLRQAGRIFVAVLRLFLFQAGTESLFNAFPSLMQNRFPFGGKCVALGL